MLQSFTDVPVSVKIRKTTLKESLHKDRNLPFSTNPIRKSASEDWSHLRYAPCIYQIVTGISDDAGNY